MELRLWTLGHICGLIFAQCWCCLRVEKKFQWTPICLRIIHISLYKRHVYINIYYSFCVKNYTYSAKLYLFYNILTKMILISNQRIDYGVFFNCPRHPAHISNYWFGTFVIFASCLYHSTAMVYILFTFSLLLQFTGCLPFYLLSINDFWLEMFIKITRFIFFLLEFSLSNSWYYIQNCVKWFYQLMRKVFGGVNFEKRIKNLRQI